MKGSITYRKDRGYHQINWYQDGIIHKITTYLDGQRLYDKRLAQKLLALMQADEERGAFRIEKFTRERYTDVIPYLREWLQAISPTLKPATIRSYRSIIETHLVAFFSEHPYQLHEIQYDTLMGLMGALDLKGKSKYNVLYVLRDCLDYAWRSNRIPSVPPFPKRKDYQIPDNPPRWISEADQIQVIESMPWEYRPIFFFLKYHYLRTNEACALYRSDFDGEVFTIRRGFSDGKLVDSPKTGRAYQVPLAEDFRPYLDTVWALHKQINEISPYLFVNVHGAVQGKHFSTHVLRNIADKALKRAGIEGLTSYSLTRHTSAGIFLNEKGGNDSELQMLLNHAKPGSTKRYGRMEIARKRELINRGKSGGRILGVIDGGRT